jgi:hypothetical protein
MTPHPFCLLSFTASIDSVTVPIWFTCSHSSNKERGDTESEKGPSCLRLSRRHSLRAFHSVETFTPSTQPVSPLSPFGIVVQVHLEEEGVA